MNPERNRSCLARTARRWGATIEDLDRWSVWRDPQASSRGSGLLEEETQGNGGKAYMFRMFYGLPVFLVSRNERGIARVRWTPFNDGPRGPRVYAVCASMSLLNSCRLECDLAAFHDESHSL